MMKSKLTENNFNAMVIDLYDYFDAKTKPKNSRLRLLYQKTHYLDSDYVKKAFKIIKDEYDGIPKNIPKAIKKTISEIQAQNSSFREDSKFGQHKRGDCLDCNGYGIFKIRHYINNIRYELIKYCGACENWRQWVNDPDEKMTAAQLKSRDVEFVPYNKHFPLESYKGFSENNTGNVSIKL